MRIIANLLPRRWHDCGAPSKTRTATARSLPTALAAATSRPAEVQGAPKSLGASRRARAKHEHGWVLLARLDRHGGTAGPSRRGIAADREDDRRRRTFTKTLSRKLWRIGVPAVGWLPHHSG